MSLLWKLTPPNGIPSFLYGTMHLQDRRAFIFKEKIEEKIKICDAFACEFRLDDATSQDNAAAISLPDGLILPDLFSKKKLRHIERNFEQITGLSLDAFYHLKPFAITNFLTLFGTNQEETLFLDQYFYEYAKKQGKELLGIETYQEQLQVFDKIPLLLQARLLAEAIENFEKNKEDLEVITKIYQEENIRKLYRTVLKGSKGVKRVLIFDRNRIMAQRIARLIAQKTVCVAIGAGHLAGYRGVLRLLQSSHVQIEPILMR